MVDFADLCFAQTEPGRQLVGTAAGVRYAVLNLMPIGSGTIRPSASAAMAGCSAAVRRLGYEGSLVPGDFVVTVTGYLDGEYGGAGWGSGAA